MAILFSLPHLRHSMITGSAGTLLLAGCAAMPGSTAGQTHLVAAQPITQPPAIVQAPPVPAPPQQLVRISRYQPPDVTGTAANIRARYAATQSPSLRGYVNAVMVYTYEPGEVYKVDTSPNFLTTIELEPGERLVSMAAGNTVQWKIGNTIMGQGAGKRVVILLKPIAASLQTNVVVTTSRRVYFLDATSYPGHSYESGISWTYPDDEFRALQAQARNVTDAQADDIGTNMNLADLDFDYHCSLVQGPRPAWFPTQVFDDGKKTFIRFPDNLGTTDAPPLFILEQGNHVSLVNYQVKGNYYVVDRLFRDAELRFGQNPQTIVKLSKYGTAAAGSAS